MPKPKDEHFESPLTLYLSYDFLPVQQQATILFGIAGAYNAILAAMQPRPWTPYPWLLYPALPIAPLCIESVVTGESVTFKFGPEKDYLPRFSFTDGDLVVLVPRWTAAAVLVGAALTWGLHAYDDFLAAQKNRLEIQKLRAEIQQFQIDRFKDPSDPIKLQLDLNLQYFRQEIQLPNVRRVEVNGIVVRPTDEKHRHE